MKIAVYTICKNEEQFISKWLASCADADYKLIVDTGSTDNTIEICNKLSKEIAHIYSEKSRLHFNQVTINPWRFDDARNFALNLLPNDIDLCIALDMDEVLTEGWREKIEAVWNDSIDRLRYNYVWSWNNGKPAVTYYGDKIHKRHGYRWKHPVHEVAVKDIRLGPENHVFIEDTLIEHYPDNSKPRSQYLPLLELAVREMPHDDRNAHYYARELMFAGQYDKAIDEFLRHLGLPTATWAAERSASYRYLGDCWFALGDYSKAETYLYNAVLEAPNEREPNVALAQLFRFKKDWKNVIKYCEIALTITDKVNSYINQPWAWSDWPNQMLKEAEDAIATETRV